MIKCPYCDETKNVELYNQSTNFNHYECRVCYNKFVALRKDTKPMYIICRDFNDPDVKTIPGPSKTFETLEQAQTVAKKMALQYNRYFYICKVVGKTKRVEVTIEEV